MGMSNWHTILWKLNSKISYIYQIIWWNDFFVKVENMYLLQTLLGTWQNCPQGEHGRMALGESSSSKVIRMSEKDQKKEIKTLIFSGEEDTWSNESIRSFGWRIQKRSPLWRPPTDVFETEDAFIVVVEVAGMRGTEISVTLEKGRLTIRGLRVDTGDMKAYHQMEIAYGEFETKIKLPKRVEKEQIEATYSDGFLRVVMPKKKAKSIQVEG